MNQRVTKKETNTTARYPNALAIAFLPIVAAHKADRSVSASRIRSVRPSAIAHRQRLDVPCCRQQRPFWLSAQAGCKWCLSGRPPAHPEPRRSAAGVRIIPRLGPVHRSKPGFEVALERIRSIVRQLASDIEPDRSSQFAPAPAKRV